MTSTVSNEAVQHFRSVEVPTQYIQVGDVRYAYRELRPPVLTTDTTPLVFLHRFRGTLDDWDPAFVDAVAQERHVILFSDAAVGSSTGSPATTVDEKASNAAAFVHGLGFDTIDVLGFSMGGFVAQALAMNEPALVRKLVLIGTGPGGNAETDPPTDLVFQIALKTEYEFDDVRYLFFAEGREIETQNYIERQALRTDREPLVGPESIQAMVGLILAFMGGETGHYSRLPEITAPTLIINGDDDHFFPVKNEFLLFRELRDAQLAIYPQAGHAPHQQHPSTVAAQVVRFLDPQGPEAAL